MFSQRSLGQLRAIVGNTFPDDALCAALKTCGGDVAAAVGRLFDQGPPVPAPQCVGNAPKGERSSFKNHLETSSNAVVNLDSDSEEDFSIASAGPVSKKPRLETTAKAAVPQMASSKSSFLADAKSKANAGETSGAPQPSFAASSSQGKGVQLSKGDGQSSLAGSRRSEPTPQQVGGGRRAVPEWAFLLGKCEISAYSTIRVTWDTGPNVMLQQDDTLELRWTAEPDPKESKTAGKRRNASSANPLGIRFSWQSQGGGQSHEVGRFPVDVARALVPLLRRGLIDVQATVGRNPPRELDLGRNVPVMLRVLLHSRALSVPGHGGGPASTAQNKNINVGSLLSAKAVTAADAEVETLREASASLLEVLRLRRRRSAEIDDGSDALNATSADNKAKPVGNEVETQLHAQSEVDGEAETVTEDMSDEAAMQLGTNAELERLHLPGVGLPPEIFKSRLKHYQAQGVFWMWQRENPNEFLPETWLAEGSGAAAMKDPSQSEDADEKAKERRLHPLWDEYELSTPATFPGSEDRAQYIYFHRTSGALSLDFPDETLSHCRGGILADEMGLGKTVMCLSLLMLDTVAEVPNARKQATSIRGLDDISTNSTGSRKQLKSFFKQDSGNNMVGCTLVVLPLSLLGQWHCEVDTHTPLGRRLTVLEYYGSGRSKSVDQLRNVDLVLTTYGTLSSEREDSPLFEVFWTRIILDEGHYIKNHVSRVFAAAYRLRGLCRWCVTGTPLQNSVDELYPLVRFLRLEPWCVRRIWNKKVSVPLGQGAQSMEQALETTRRISQQLVIRRTKRTIDPRTGKQIVELPPRSMNIIDIELSSAEKDFYESVYAASKTQFDTFVSSGTAMSQFTQIFVLILRLRQALCHPHLCFARKGAKTESLDELAQRCLQDMAGKPGGDSASAANYVGDLFDNLKRGELPDCPICCEEPEDPVITPCGHVFCRECGYAAVKKLKGECAICRRPGVDEKSLRVLPGASRIPSKLTANKGALCSAKMKALLPLLQDDMKSGRKAVVFSQWGAFLDLIGQMLDHEELPWQRLDGSCSIAQRQDRIKWLKESNAEGPKGKILLISLRAGGVGLNLVAASRLYLMDLWWNPAVEEQAIQRVHRIGQTEEVKIFKFITRGSIDEGIMQLQRTKAKIVEGAVVGGAQEGSSKISLDDFKFLFSPCKPFLPSSLKSRGETPAFAKPSAAAMESLEIQAQVARWQRESDIDCEMASAEVTSVDPAVQRAQPVANTSLDVNLLEDSETVLGDVTMSEAGRSAQATGDVNSVEDSDTVFGDLTMQCAEETVQATVSLDSGAMKGVSAVPVAQNISGGAAMDGVQSVEKCPGINTDEQDPICDVSQEVPEDLEDAWDFAVLAASTRS